MLTDMHCKTGKCRISFLLNGSARTGNALPASSDEGAAPRRVRNSFKGRDPRILPPSLPPFLPSYGTLSTPLGRIFPHHRQASKSVHEVGCKIYTQSRPDFPRINVVLLIFMDHDQAGKLKVREFAFVFPIALPKPGRVEEEINKISRTFTYHFQSMTMTKYCTPLSPLPPTYRGIFGGCFTADAAEAPVCFWFLPL